MNVKQVTDKNMAGDTIAEKQINALLTITYIASGDIPYDECIRETRHVINMIHEGLHKEVAKYLEEQFGIGSAYDRKLAISTAESISKIIRNQTVRTA